MTREEICNPFIEGTLAAFESIYGRQPSQRNPHLHDSDATISSWEICAIINLFGLSQLDFVSYGSVSLNLKLSCAAELVRVMTGDDSAPPEEMVIDGIGELANQMVGVAKSKFAGRVLHMSTPEIITGQGLKVHAPEGIRKVTILPFEFLSDFTGPEVFDLSVALDTRYFS